jgi:hypothetical protein
MQDKIIEFGAASLMSYSNSKSLVLGFRCNNEIHLVGINNIRSHYKIDRFNFNQKIGIEMFMNDCKNILNKTYTD